MLESKLGIDLFHRSTRQVRLTGSGKSLFRTTHRIFQELEEEVFRIVPMKEQLVLTVSVSTFFVTRWLSQRLGQFLNQHPEITIRLQHSVNDPDFTVEDVDLAIRWGDGNWPQSASEMIIPSPMMAVCSPQLKSIANGLSNIDDLRRQTFLHDQEGNDSWREWLALAGMAELDAGPGPVIVDPNVRVQSAIDGQGLVLANILLLDDIKSGRLIEPFDIQLEGYGFHLLYSESTKRRHAFSLFRRWLLQESESFNNDLATGANQPPG